MSYHSTATVAPRRHRARGITLIDLMLVIAVFVALSLLALPSVNQIDAIRCVRAARLFISDVQYARALSIANATDPCVIRCDPGGHRYFLGHRDSPSRVVYTMNGDPFEREYGIGEAQHLRGVTIDAGQIPDGIMEFTSKGSLALGTDAEVVFTAGTHSCAVRVNSLTGTSRLVP